MTPPPTPDDGRSPSAQVSQVATTAPSTHVDKADAGYNKTLKNRHL